MPGDLAKRALAGTRFEDVRWVAETGSTQADLLELARHGEREGVVLVADHQSAGRGRQGRTWDAPPGASLLVSILLRPTAERAGLATMAVAVSAAEAVDELAGVRPRLKWPNDLVWPGDGSAPDRKLAGVLAEADWPARSASSGGWSEPPADERVTVVVGIGINVEWPAAMPAELADIATAINHVAGSTVDREALLVALLRRLDRWYAAPRAELLERWRALSATLGRRVRIDLGSRDVEGTAVDVDDEGHLVVDTDGGERRTFAVGDVVHVRPAP